MRRCSQQGEEPLKCSVVHVGVIVGRILVHSDLNIAEALDGDLRRKRAEVTIPAQLPAFPVTCTERRWPHYRLQATHDRHPDLESFTCRFRFALNFAQRLSQIRPTQAIRSFKVDE